MLQIQQATPEEFEQVLEFYNQVTNAMKDKPYNSGWKVGVYPDAEFLQTAIANKELYIAKEGTDIISGFIINNHYHKGYNELQWDNDFTKDEILVIHTLAVSVAYQGKGVAKEMCQYVLRHAKENGIKAVWLEVLAKNVAAQNLYTGLGFKFVGSAVMFYEDTGATEYKVYEYII